MKKILLTVGSILGIVLPVIVSTSCGTHAPKQTRTSTTSIDNHNNGISDLSTLGSIDNKDKPYKHIKQISLINPDKTKDEIKDQELSQVIEDAIKSLDSLFLDKEQKDEAIGNLRKAKTKDEVVNIRDAAAALAGIDN